MAPLRFETHRLVLRPPEQGDIAAIFDYASDAEVTAYMEFERLKSCEEAAEFVERCKLGWRSGKENTWVIMERESNTLVGAIAMRGRQKDADFGYILNRTFWHRGFATEAASAMLAWMSSVQSFTRIWATCDVENQRSSRVLERLGLAREGLVRGGMIRPNLSDKPRPSYIYVKPRPGA